MSHWLEIHLSNLCPIIYKLSILLAFFLPKFGNGRRILQRKPGHDINHSMGKSYISSIVVSIVILFAGIPSSEAALVSSDRTMHIAAHSGASYIMTHASEVVCTAIFKRPNKLACTIVGVALSAGAGIAKEVVIDSQETHKQHLEAYAENASGIGAALTFISFSW
ncbi:MAG: hypothetical protein JWQ35_2155 [Bacteriovoracaceae bacterium]|nr:hypothetical protein [Bacteriovoracaceae bacterium]